MNNLKKFEILGVKIDNLTFAEAVEKIIGFTCDGKKHYAATVNPEFLVAAQKDLEFKRILNGADLTTADGMGVILASRILDENLKFSNYGLKERIAGTDLVEALCLAAEQKGLTVGFLGAGPGVAKLCAERLKYKHSQLKVTFAEAGSEVDKEGKQINGEDLRFMIDDLRIKTDILFVAFGQVKQEKWIIENLPKIPVKVAIGVGGAFDFISGRKKRAPLWLRNLGLEWFFRLILEPWRWRRQLALPYFIYLILRERFAKLF